MVDDRHQHQPYDVTCDRHGDLGQVIGAYDAAVLVDTHRRFVMCDRAVANPARLRQRAIRRIAR
jgi:hypothetical protein